MNKKECISIVCLLLICSCSKTPPNLPLSNDTAKNSKIIKAFIPRGTPVSMAILKMEQEGFSCKIMRDETIRNPKDAIQASRNSNVDFVLCERKMGTIIFRRWQVIMSLDGADKTDNVSVTSGLGGS